jgi:uncharacterized protein DUF4399
MTSMTLPFLARGLVLVAMASVVSAQAPPKTKSVEGTTVYFVSPKNGETVGQTFTVRFGLKGMGIAPAGVQFANTGHHHLLVDMAEPPNMDAALPVTDNIRHFGAGQTEADIKLPPGKHTLQLLFADYLHIPHDKPVISEKITIEVK